MTISAEIQRKMLDAKTAALDPKPQLAEMLLVLMDQAADIELRQLRLLVTGDRDTPYAPELRKMAVLDAAAGFIRACIERPEEVAKRLRGKKREASA